MDAPGAGRRRLAIVACFFVVIVLAGAVRASLAPRSTKHTSCIHLALAHDSIYVMLHALPCDKMGVDTITTMSVASMHRRCDGYGEIDPDAQKVVFVWGACGPSASSPQPIRMAHEP